MIDLSTRYMGLNLKNPIVASASPLCDSVDKIRLSGRSRHRRRRLAVSVRRAAYPGKRIRGCGPFPGSRGLSGIAQLLSRPDELQPGSGRLSRTDPQGQGTVCPFLLSPA